MKKAAAIFLLCITLYNLGGYLLMFQYFIYRSDVFAEQQIGKSMYKATDLVEIKIPVHLPGIDSWRGYENVSGTVELAQNTYNYVRMKMSADTIYVMCVPNYKTTRLIKQNVICAREVSDAPLNSKKQTTPVKSIKILSHVLAQVISVTPQLTEVVSIPHISYKDEPVTGIVRLVAEPPEALTA